MHPPTPQPLLASFLAPIFALAPTAMNDLIPPSPALPLTKCVDDLLAPLQYLINDKNRNTLLTLHAAILILADDLDHSHTLCQNISTPYASAWHAVIHRREGDFWNSNYWWRRAANIQWNSLPADLIAALAKAPSPLAEWKSELAAGRYDPSHFTHLVERHHAEPSLAPYLLTIQRQEWMSLFVNTCEQLN